MLDRLRRYWELVLFKTLAELRNERQRTYLGFLWWLFEPAFFMLVFYLVFDVLMKRGGPDYVPMLLSGLILWQWFNNGIMHCTTSIQTALPLARTVKVPMTLFPLATILADTTKFAFVFVVLVGVLWALGHPPNFAYIALPVVLFAEFTFTCGVSFLVAAIVPLVPDLRFVISPVLQGLFFLSAIFYSFDSVSPEMRHWLNYNPMAVMIDSGRQIILYGQIPDLGRLVLLTLVGAIVLLAGVGAVSRLTPVYPKLAE
ncbi:MAG: ABC transporter permease [Rhodanobacteraceae bacterium]